MHAMHSVNIPRSVGYRSPTSGDRQWLSGIVAIVDDLVRAMDAAASPENARALARYFKVAPGSYGEGDIFLGLKLGELRQLAKPYSTQPSSPISGFRCCAARFMSID